MQHKNVQNNTGNVHLYDCLATPSHGHTFLETLVVSTMAVDHSGPLQVLQKPFWQTDKPRNVMKIVKTVCVPTRNGQSVIEVYVLRANVTIPLSDHQFGLKPNILLIYLSLKDVIKLL